MKNAKTIILISAVALIAYGYICRIASSYFFWDSKIIGWFLLFIGLFLALLNAHRSRKRRGEKTGWVKLAIAFFIIGFIAAPLAIFMMKNSEAYAFATDFIKNDSTIANDVGSVKGFGLFPTGSLSTVSINGIESGEAAFSFTVKGSKKYRDVYIHLRKQHDSNWKVLWVE
jgi:hypothetical protein